MCAHALKFRCFENIIHLKHENCYISFYFGNKLLKIKTFIGHFCADLMLTIYVSQLFKTFNEKKNPMSIEVKKITMNKYMPLFRKL